MEWKRDRASTILSGILNRHFQTLTMDYRGGDAT